MFDQVAIMKGEIRCLSLLGLKGLFTRDDVVSQRLVFGRWNIFSSVSEMGMFC